MDINTSDAQWKNFKFEGSAGEYFGIAITNLFLTILTLGIYSAWAKVVRSKYFANKTLVQDTPILYHATGMQILKGRLVALLFLILVSIFLTFAPLSLNFVGILGLLFLTPWIFNRSIKFNLKMHSYRNIRFDFTGSYWSTFFYTIVAPLISILTLFLLAPWFGAKSGKYFMTNTYWGTKKIDSKLCNKAFYNIFFKYFLITLIFILPIVFCLFIGEVDSAFTFGLLIAYFYLPILFILYKTITNNLLINSLSFEETSQFKSNLSGWSIIGIGITNFLAIVFSVGLLYPWATIRLKRYLIENREFLLIGDLDSIVDKETGKMNAISEGVSDLDSDFNLDLPI
tara:strand:+ start:647 stop:1672 length:1026 start_codon:yes stop_codon:yes gene_type:complete